MKTQDLIKLLEKHPGFDVRVCFQDLEGLYENWDICGIADVGHSDKILYLDKEWG